MFVRRTLAGAVAAALAGSAIALSAGPASAAVDPDDTTFAPTTADLIGVGSDTSQHAMKVFADAWNARTPAPAFRIATYAATGGGTIALPNNAAFPRPNGSGNGKAKLYGADNNTDIDFARSSAENSPAETAAGLQAFPFALDTLVMAVSNSVPSHAPASLTPQQILGIYEGTITDWSQVGGAAGTIKPKIPQTGSGTRSFFTSQLNAIKGGTANIDFTKVSEVQEHDDATIKGDADAIAPFSKGRAGLLGTTLRLEGGWSADRALYNVVRGTDLNNAAVQAAFGTAGALCATASRDMISAAGFEQLATPANGGVCGQATQGKVTNFKTNVQVATASKLVATSPAAKSSRLVASVSGKTAPQGTFDFYEGATKVASGVPLVSSTATANLSNVAAGAHTYRAVFVPAAGYDPSEATASVTVSDVAAKAKVKIAESFPAKLALKKKAKVATAKGVVSIKGATGKVTVSKGKKKLDSAKLKKGKAAFTLKKMKPGKHKLTIRYAGDATHLAGTKTFTIKVVKAKK
ncbi:MULTISPECIES: Ig-like domain repeat protein [unclassified Nocardioides]|uniref:Ig-like domain repeat protein n=1 Tax=unclassified Nocardioides TaxID=2615069 RepID=UPI00361D9005